MFSKCAKCDNRVVTQTYLIGQYVTALCAEHRNEFHLYMKEHKERIKLDVLSVKYDYALENKSKRKTLKLRKKYRKQEDVLYAVSEQWAIAQNEDE